MGSGAGVEGNCCGKTGRGEGGETDVIHQRRSKTTLKKLRSSVWEEGGRWGRVGMNRFQLAWRHISV